MAVPLPDINYPVLVTVREGGFELHIRELLLAVHAPDLRTAYEQLLERKLKIFNWARTIDALDELPPPDPVPHLVEPQTHRPAGTLYRGATALSRLYDDWTRSR